MAVKSKGKGKSAGLRIITFVYVIKNETGETNVFLLSIYDKSDYESLPEHLIKNMVAEIQDEFESTKIDEAEDLSEEDKHTPTE